MKKSELQWAVALIAGLGLLVIDAEAKPGGGKGKDKGGPPAHAEKGKPNKGAQASKGKPDKGGGHPASVNKGKAKGGGSPAQVKGGKGKPDKAVVWNADRREKARFVDRDRDSVLGYFHEYRDRDHGLPPGLAKNLQRGKPLPPGWRKKLSPGVVIAADWWDRFVPLPYSYFPNLQPVPDTRLYWYGDRVYRVYEPRREVVDVIVVPTIHIDL